MPVLQGIEQLDSKLNQLKFSVQQKMLMAALKKSAEVTRLRAAENAPVLTGKLRGAIRVATAPSLSSAYVAVVRVGPSRKGFYGSFQEFGTSFHTPQSFLGPAFEETEQQVMARTAEEFKRAVEAVAA